MSELIRGRLNMHGFWFVSPEILSDEKSTGLFYEGDEKHKPPSGTLVDFDEGAKRAYLVEGDHKGWCAPFVNTGITPISPLEQLACEAE